MFDETTKCLGCDGKKKVDGKDCVECKGEGRVPYYSYHCAFDDSESRNPPIEHSSIPAEYSN